LLGTQLVTGLFAAADTFDHGVSGFFQQALLTEQVPAEQVLTEQALAEQVLTEQALAWQTVAEQTLAEQTLAEQSLARQEALTADYPEVV
jgi:hypothetical protein